MIDCHTLGWYCLSDYCHSFPPFHSHCLQRADGLGQALVPVPADDERHGAVGHRDLLLVPHRRLLLPEDLDRQRSHVHHGARRRGSHHTGNVNRRSRLTSGIHLLTYPLVAHTILVK